MKPSLRRAPLTHEDFEISLKWVGRSSDALNLALMLVGENARDADLMSKLTRYDHWERDYTRNRVRSVATAFRLVWRQI